MLNKKATKNTTVGCITYELAKSSVKLCVKTNKAQRLRVILMCQLFCPMKQQMRSRCGNSAMW